MSSDLTIELVSNTTRCICTNVEIENVIIHIALFR